MINKKASGTLWGIFLSILIVMALFYGTFNYINYNYTSANITDELGYNQSYADLRESQTNLTTQVERIKGSARNISEADGSLSIAWNGLTGLAATLRLFFSIIDVGIEVWNALFPGLSFLPGWVKLLAEMGIIIYMVLIIIGAFKGEAKT